MSRHALCLGSSLRLTYQSSSRSRRAAAAIHGMSGMSAAEVFGLFHRWCTEFRRFAHAAIQQEHEQRFPMVRPSEEPGTRSSEPTPSPPLQQQLNTPSASTSSSTGHIQQHIEEQEQEDWVDETGWSPDPTRRRPTDRRREEYFSRLFHPLKFPAELAQRTLTHNSHSMARQGHNAALAFIGPRSVLDVLSTVLFLTRDFSFFFSFFFFQAAE